MVGRARWAQLAVVAGCSCALPGSPSYAASGQGLRTLRVGPVTTTVPSDWSVRVRRDRSATFDYLGPSGARVNDVGIAAGGRAVGLTVDAVPLALLRRDHRTDLGTSGLALLLSITGAPNSASSFQLVAFPRPVWFPEGDAAAMAIGYRYGGRPIVQQDIVARRGSTVAFLEADGPPRLRSAAYRDMASLESTWQW